MLKTGEKTGEKTGGKSHLNLEEEFSLILKYFFWPLLMMTIDVSAKIIMLMRDS